MLYKLQTAPSMFIEVKEQMVSKVSFSLSQIGCLCTGIGLYVYTHVQCQSYLTANLQNHEAHELIVMSQFFTRSCHRLVLLHCFRQGGSILDKLCFLWAPSNSITLSSVLVFLSFIFCLRLLTLYLYMYLVISLFHLLVKQFFIHS